MPGALVTAHKLRGTGSEAVLGTVLTGLWRPGAGSRQPQSRSQALEQPAQWEPLWGGCLAIVEWGGGLRLWVRNIRSEASLKKGLRFRPKFLKEGTISLGGTIPEHSSPHHPMPIVSPNPMHHWDVQKQPHVSSPPALRLAGLSQHWPQATFSSQALHSHCAPLSWKARERSHPVPTHQWQREFCTLDVWSTEWRGQCGAFHQNIPPAFLFPGWRADFAADDGAGGSSGDSTDTMCQAQLWSSPQLWEKGSVTPHFTNTDTEA